MARTTKQLSGGGKDKFLRGLVAGVADVPAEAAERVSAVLADAITEVRVRRDTWDTQRTAPIATAAPQKKSKPAVAPSTAVAPPTATVPAATAPAATAPAAPTFDPFAFSAVAVLTKKGKAGLATQLGTIASADHLRKLAEAQHLALDPAITDAADMRAALVVATERRIAERKAAAS